MKVFVAGLGTETNCFSNTPTTLEDFRQFILLRPGSGAFDPTEHTYLLWAAQKRAETGEFDLCAGTFAHACPGGLTTRDAFESLRDEILTQLRAAGPVDAVALSLHGAMMAEGYDDCEGDLLTRVREIAGSDVPIGIVLDPHCHLTERMQTTANVIVALKEYPHTDFAERAEDVLNLLCDIHHRHIRPAISVFDCHFIDALHTTREPMLSFLEKVRALEARGDILSISVIHSFPWGDVADVGAKVLVITNDAPETGAEIAAQLGQELFSFRGNAREPTLSLEAALDRAAKATLYPIVIADTSDNPGGGAPGDATFFLAAIHTLGLKKVCLGPFHDPATVAQAFAAGTGSKFVGTIGGRGGPLSGRPVAFEGRVTGLRRAATQDFCGLPVPIGDSAGISFDGIEVVVTASRSQALSPDLFTNVGIDPSVASVIVIKSSQHFYDAFAPIAADVIYAEAPGLLNLQSVAARYSKLGERRLWPLHDVQLKELISQSVWQSTKKSRDSALS